jgi:hypothetical protein
MKVYTCAECGLSFNPKTGTQRYCSECLFVTYTCGHCGEAFQDRRHRPRKYCSNTCSAFATGPSKARRGPENNRYNGGLCFDKNQGRWLICTRDGKAILYARAVMEAHLRRFLRSDEIVHHRNGDPADDRVENLQIVTRSEHMEIHRDEIMAARYGRVMA